MKIKILIASLLGLLFSMNAMAADYAQSTPAVWGYDVVSYHTNKRPVRGSGHFAVEHKGATYLFASLEHKNCFLRIRINTYRPTTATALLVWQKAKSSPVILRCGALWTAPCT